MAGAGSRLVKAVGLASGESVCSTTMQSMCEWLAAVNYHLEEGTVELDMISGALRFRFALPLGQESCRPEIVRYVLSTVRHNTPILLAEAHQLLRELQEQPENTAILSSTAIRARVHGISGLVSDRDQQKNEGSVPPQGPTAPEVDV